MEENGHTLSLFLKVKNKLGSMSSGLKLVGTFLPPINNFYKLRVKFMNPTNFLIFSHRKGMTIESLIPIVSHFFIITV